MLYSAPFFLKRGSVALAPIVCKEKPQFKLGISLQSLGMSPNIPHPENVEVFIGIVRRAGLAEMALCASKLVLPQIVRHEIRKYPSRLEQFSTVSSHAYAECENVFGQKGDRSFSTWVAVGTSIDRLVSSPPGIVDAPRRKDNRRTRTNVSGVLSEDLAGATLRRRAIAETTAPSSSASATIAARTSSGQRRRRPALVITSIRPTISAPCFGLLMEI